MSFSDFLEPVSINFTLKDHTYSLLKDAILKMDIYSPNAELRLDERELASQLGISRTPIREALARLEQDAATRLAEKKAEPPKQVAENNNPLFPDQTVFESLEASIKS